MSLRTRIVLVASVAVALTVAAVAITNYTTTRSQLRSQVDQALDDRVRPLYDAEGDGRAHMYGDDFGRIRAVPFGGAGGALQIVRPDGTTIQSGPEGAALPVDDRARRIAQRGAGRAYSDGRAQGVHLRILTVGAGPSGALQVARPLTEVDNVLRRQLLALALVGGVGIIGAAGVGFLVARTALAPISRFTKSTEALTGHPDLTQRLDVDGRDEIARLAQSFNTTLDALERSVESQRHLVADASHELRTPIASLRANIQVLEDADRLPEHEREALRADIIGELDELTAIVGDIVELARGTKRGEVLDDVRVDDVVRVLADRARRRSARDVEFTLALEPTVVSGEPERISRAVSNLLDNACKWSPPGSIVEVELRDGVLTVRDHGPGFDEADLPHVFERFYRADKARATQGSGLGLAIVRQAAEAHGGWVEAANAADGGAVLRVRFGPSEPVAEAPVADVRIV